MMATRSRPSLYAATGTWPYPICSDSPSRKTKRRCSTFGSFGSVRKVRGGTPVAGGWSGITPSESSLWSCPRQAESNVSSVSPNRICSSPLCSTVQPRSVPHNARWGCTLGTFGPTQRPTMCGDLGECGWRREQRRQQQRGGDWSDHVRPTGSTSSAPVRNDAAHDGTRTVSAASACGREEGPLDGGVDVHHQVA